MDDIKLFLAHAIQLEQDAARRFEDLMHAMRNIGNDEVEGLFRRLAQLSRMHLKEAQKRGGFRDIPKLAPDEFRWPGGITPEAASWSGVDDGIDIMQALELALAGERSGHGYYQAVAQETSDPEVKIMAEEFEQEEAQHVAELERWISRFAA